MKVVFVSNYLNHHQLPLSQALYSEPDLDYTFIATATPSEERKRLGYSDINHDYPFVLCSYDSCSSKEKARSLIKECDILLAGNCPDEYILERIRAGKPVCKISERYFKEKKTPINILKHFFRAKRHLAPFQNHPLYFLCASAYLPSDLNRFTDFTGKTYKWGYFPEVRRYEPIETVFEKKRASSPVKLLWAGRLIDWKHPEYALLAANELKSKGYDFNLRIVGTGGMEAELKEKIEKYGLEESVRMEGPMSPEQVRECMEESDIFLFTSDMTEGWGAVLNESMNSACAVVACRQAGATPYLVTHGQNGMIFDSKEEFLNMTEQLVKDASVREAMGRAAYRTIVEDWNGDVAAKRLLTMLKELMKNKSCNLYESGPCSPAYTVSSDGDL